ncbi:MAG: substrate-binding domain-containing protein [Synergistales bacterium]|nr:substrate-binding domain-containing protein [Synergistales bacterium]
MNKLSLFSLALLCFLLLMVFPVRQANAEVMAVAAGIAPAVEAVIDDFVDQGGEPFDLVKGPCGALARQMKSGAPFDIVLLSEPRWPGWMEEQGLLVDVAPFARGQLVLMAEGEAPPSWPPAPDAVVAIPEPDSTAYGLLAKQYLQERGEWVRYGDTERTAFVGGAPQAVMAVRHGAADLAFVPRSAAQKVGGAMLVLEGMTTPQVGGLAPDAGPSARAFWEFCRQPAEDATWRSMGLLPLER